LLHNELLKLIGDVIQKSNKLPKDMYHSKKLVKGIGMDYQRLMSVKITACFLGRITRKRTSASNVVK
jgi:hypothetical protein